MHHRPHRAVRLITAVYMTIAAVACGSDDPTQPEIIESAAGNYTLGSMSHPHRPTCSVDPVWGCTIPNTGDTLVILLGGRLELATNGTFTLNITGTSGGLDGTVVGVTGTYTQSGRQMTFTLPHVPAPLVGRFRPSSDISSTYVYFPDAVDVTIPGAAVGHSQGFFYGLFTRNQEG